MENKTQTSQQEEMVTFYHTFLGTKHFHSFFREGAKPIGYGFGGQKRGFFTYDSKEAAMHLLRNRLRREQYTEPSQDGIIVAVRVPKSSVVYPLWQPDMNMISSMQNLCLKYGDFINAHAHHLDIPFDAGAQLEDDEEPWDFEKITGISYEKTDRWFPEEDLVFEGIDERGHVKKLPNMHSWKGASQRLQIATDWLCENNPTFQQEYNALMQEKLAAQDGFAFKYRGDPLPIAFAEYIKVDPSSDKIICKKVIFDAQQNKPQVCPFLTMGLAQKARG